METQLPGDTPRARGDAPLVSVIVPVYNTEAFLDQALGSIEGQTLEEIEIICVNDGSTDSSPAILEAHAARDARIRIIDKPNGGYGSACNRGIDAARGTWIAIVEPDDWIQPTMYADMLAYAATFDGTVDIVKTPYWRIIDPDTPRERKLNCSYRKRIRPHQEPFDMRDPGAAHLLMHHPSIWSAIYHAGFIRRCNIRFKEIPGAGWADNPFIIETLCQASRIVYLDRAYYRYREETPEQATASVRRDPLMPLQRWHDMQDAIDRIGAGWEPVMRSQVRRAFAYLDHISTGADLDDPALQLLTKRMFRRLNARLVMEDAHLSPNWKRVYCREMGLPEPPAKRLSYMASLASAALYSLVNIGPKAMLELTGVVVKRDGEQSGFASGEAVRTPSGTGAAQAADDDDGDGSGTPGGSVSIVIPVYNAERYLRACLESAATQTYGNIEIVCVDDGSSDSSGAILEEFAARDGRFRIIAQPNGGPSAARNTGLRHAGGDYVLFLDSDDILEPDACSRIVRAFGEGTFDAVSFGWSCFPPERANRWLTEHMKVRDAIYPRFTDELLFEEMTQPYLRSAFRRGFLIEQGIAFDEGISIGEDTAFIFSALARADGVRLVSDRLYRYRMPHEGSLMEPVRDDVPEKCLRDYLMMGSIFHDWSRDGTLDGHCSPLVEWYVKFLLYTILMQHGELRDQLVALTRMLWIGYIPEPVMRSLPLPAHAAGLVRIVLDADADGHLNIGEGRLRAAIMRYRIGEYGIADIAATIRERAGGEVDL